MSSVWNHFIVDTCDNNYAVYIDCSIHFKKQLIDTNISYEL